MRSSSTSPLSLCLVIGLLGAAGCAHDPPPTASKPVAPAAPIAAEGLRVATSAWPLVARSQGSLIADEVVVVGAKVSGRVGEVHVDLGDVVRPDTIVMSLERAELELAAAQADAALFQARAAVGLAPEASLETLQPSASPPVREAQAVLDEAELKRERVERLKQRNAVTEAEWQEAQAAEKVALAKLGSAINSVQEKIALIRVRQAEASLAHQRLKDAVIVAPFQGVVQQRHVAPGSYVQVGQPVVTIVRTNPLRFRGTLPERYARRLAIGQEVRVSVDANSEPCRTKVARISPALDQSSRSLAFEADLDNSAGRLQPGLFAEAGVVLDAERQAVVIPAECLVEFAGIEKVWKVVDGQCLEQVVQVGEHRDDRVEVLSGLQVGDVILMHGAAGKSGPVNLTSIVQYNPAGTELVAGGVPTSRADDGRGD